MHRSKSTAAVLSLLLFAGCAIGPDYQRPAVDAPAAYRGTDATADNHSFADVAEAATFEAWTHDPFDRMIVAHAKANGYAPLVTADEKIRANYPRTVW